MTRTAPGRERATVPGPARNPNPATEPEADMSHPNTPIPPAGYVPAHSGMCPLGDHLVCRDFNAMPQRMWRTDRQTWPCEGCGVTMVRTITHGRWSSWQPVDQ